MRLAKGCYRSGANLNLMFSSSIICIGGLPGVGSVGKIAADYLSTALECSTFKPFYSKGFPAQVMVSNGLAGLFHAELKVPKDRSNMYILCGDAQPLEIKEMYSLAGDILEAARSQKVTDMITLAAYVGDSKDKVVGAASEPELALGLEKNGIPKLRNGAIGGINGLLAGLSPLYDIRGYCLLGTTSGEELIDLNAAKNLLEAIKRLLGLDISIEGLEFEESKEVSCHQEIDMNYR
jgi:proteasome assembly chaperone (PAC2) family protein